MSVVAKRLDVSRCHMVWRHASALATLCQMGTQLSLPERGTGAPLSSAHAYCCQTFGHIGYCWSLVT